MTSRNLEAWALPNSLEFYRRSRTRLSDLYASEASMLMPVAGRSRSVLDVGCAVGNFIDILRELNPAIEYTGVDTCAQMIEEARRLHPGGVFQVADGTELPFGDGSFDLVLCTGVLNHNPDYVHMIGELARVARHHVVVDLPRLVAGPYTFDLETSYLEVGRSFQHLDGTEDSRVPYVLANARDAFERLTRRLDSRMRAIACHGYHGRNNPAVRVPYESVVFAVALLVMGSGRLRHHLNLPDDVSTLALEGIEAAAPAALAADSVEALLAG